MCSANVCIVLTPLVQTDQLIGRCGGGGGGARHRCAVGTAAHSTNRNRRAATPRGATAWPAAHAAALLTLRRCVHVFMLLSLRHGVHARILVEGRLPSCQKQTVRW